MEDPQGEIDAAMKRWGFPKRDTLTVVYDPDLDDVAQTTGDRMIRVGPKAFQSDAYLASTLDHEFTHVEQYMDYRAGKLGTAGNALNEVEAYNRELSHADRYGLSVDEMAGIRATRDFYYNQLGAWDRMGTWFGMYSPSSADLYRQRPRRRVRRRRRLSASRWCPVAHGCQPRCGGLIRRFLPQTQTILVSVLAILAMASMACGRQRNVRTNMTGVAEATSASLSIVQPSEPLHADSSKINVVLRNEGQSSFWVNKRGFSGYHGKPSPLRELSMEVRDSNGNPVEFHCFDKSEMARKSDYALLAPGASLHFKMGLFCFRFKGPGTYTVVAYYRDGNSDPATVPGSPVLVGELVSAPATIRLAE